MKWTSRRSTRIDYFEHRADCFEIVTAILLVVMAIAFVLLILALAQTPRQTSADDWVNLRVATRSASRGSSTDVSVAVLHKTPLEESKLVALPASHDKSVTRSAEPVKVLYMEISAYSPTVAECDASPLVTASGKRVYVGGIAADLRVLPFGSIVIIPGYNGGKPCTVIDTGGAIHGLKLDVFLWSAHEAVHWGRRKNVRVEVLYIPKVKK